MKRALHDLHLRAAESRSLPQAGHILVSPHPPRCLASTGAIAVGLGEVLDEDYLQYRIKSTAYVVEKLDKVNIPMMRPAGGHAVYLDARRFLPHIEPLQYPGWALSIKLYIEAGIRGVEIGTVMFGYDPEKKVEHPAEMDLLRLAMPRRVYTQSHMDYLIEAVDGVYRRREAIRGLKIVEAPPFLRHFTARFEWT